MVGIHSWSKTGARGKHKEEYRAQVGTCGGDKDQFTVQFPIAKDGTKLPPCVTFKGDELNGTIEHRANTVARELKNRLCDAHGNEHPPEDITCLTCNDAGNSKRYWTIDVLQRVIFPHMKVEEGLRGVLLLDDFKSHSTNEVKERVKSHKSSSCDDDDKDRHDLVDVHMLSDGTTPKAQPVDLFVGKVTKVHYRNYYDTHMLDTPVSTTTGHPLIPIRQLCATWIVKA